MLQVIKKAERFPSGRIRGAPPAALVPRVLKVLTAAEMAKVAEMDAKRHALQREFLTFLESVGLPTKPGIMYLFGQHGEVTIRGNRAPRY